MSWCCLRSISDLDSFGRCLPSCFRALQFLGSTVDTVHTSVSLAFWYFTQFPIWWPWTLRSILDSIPRPSHLAVACRCPGRLRSIRILCFVGAGFRKNVGVFCVLSCLWIHAHASIYGVFTEFHSSSTPRGTFGRFSRTSVRRALRFWQSPVRHRNISFVKLLFERNALLDSGHLLCVSLGEGDSDPEDDSVLLSGVRYSEVCTADASVASRAEFTWKFEHFSLSTIAGSLLSAVRVFQQNSFREPSMDHSCELSRAWECRGRREFYSQVTWHLNSLHARAALSTQTSSLHRVRTTTTITRERTDKVLDNTSVSTPFFVSSGFHGVPWRTRRWCREEAAGARHKRNQKPATRTVKEEQHATVLEDSSPWGAAATSR